MNGKATLGDAPGPPVRRSDALSMTAKRRCIAGPSAQKAADGKLLCDEIVSADTYEGGIPVKRLSRTLFQLPPVPGEVATNTGKHQNFKSGGRLSDGAASFQNGE